MFKLLYQLGLWLVIRLLPILGLISKKVRTFNASRKKEKEAFCSFKRPEGKLYWFHCASLGEYEQAKPIIKALEERDQCFTFITFFSPSGYEVVKLYNLPNTYVSYLPLEDKRVLKRFTGKVKPNQVFWVKYELWLLALEAILKLKIPTYLISANLNKGHFVTQFWAGNWRKLLRKFNQIFVQNEVSHAVLEELDIKSIVSGDTRFDNVIQLAAQGYENEKIEQWKGASYLMVAGSSWQGEEAVLFPYLAHHKNVKLILAPHQIGNENVMRIGAQLKHLGISYALWDEQLDEQVQVVVANCIGILSKVYNLGNIAFVGGGYKQGLHNILEPLAWGKQVLTGPNIQNNWEALEARKKGVLMVIKDTEDLSAFFAKEENINLDATIIQDFVSNYSKASSIILENV